MTDTMLHARILMCVVAVVPPAVAYWWGGHYDDFPKGSLSRLAVYLVVMFLIMGSFWLQVFIFRNIGHVLRGDAFFLGLFIAECAVGLITLFTAMYRHDKESGAED